MWYEILPSFAIITAALGVPGWGLYHIHNLVNGNHHRRSLLDRWERSQYQRDIRLAGNAYVTKGLESIPPWDERELAAKAPKRIVKQNL